jgi:hypothetical protein
LVNAGKLWIPEMDRMNQMIEIMHLAVSIFAMDVSGTLSLDATQTLYQNRDTLKNIATRPGSRN